MFESLSDRLSGVFRDFRGQGRLTEENVQAGLREVRLALRTSTSRSSKTLWKTCAKNAWARKCSKA